MVLINLLLVEDREIVVGNFVVIFFVKVGLDNIVSGYLLFSIFKVIFFNRWLLFGLRFLVVYIICWVLCSKGVNCFSMFLKVWFGIIIRMLWLCVMVVVKLFLIDSVLGKGVLGRYCLFWWLLVIIDNCLVFLFYSMVGVLLWVK